jgi:hypothetical protein
MKIPDDIYFRVLDLATSLVNSSESLDQRTYWTLYNELRELCETEAAAGRPHPFLFETLADFTDDDRIAVELYRKGLEHAAQPDTAAYRASLQFAIAERYKSLGDRSLAYEWALRADEVARNLDDLDLRKQISEFLLTENTHT